MSHSPSYVQRADFLQEIFKISIDSWEIVLYLVSKLETQIWFVVFHKYVVLTWTIQHK